MRRLSLLLVIVSVISGCAVTGESIRGTPTNVESVCPQGEREKESDSVETGQADSITIGKAILHAESSHDEIIEELVVSPDRKIEIRILADDVNEVMQEIQNLSKVFNYKAVGRESEDNILFYEMQLENNFRMRERLLVLLANATDLQEILTLENELNRVNSDIETLESQLLRMLAEARRALSVPPAFANTQKKPSFFESLLFYSLMGISWLLINK